MIQLKTILSIILAAALTATTGLLPFVLLHWGLGGGTIISILGVWLWCTLVISLILITDINSDPKKEDE